jgi:hypothetical protein
MKYVITLFAAAVFILSCKKNKEADIPACTQSLIDSALSKPKETLFVRVDCYQYNGDIVYLYISGCCDKYNDLRDMNCKYLFSPSGGFMGCGDCSHPDFSNKAKFLKNIWVDPRP